MGWTPQAGLAVVDRGGTRFVLRAEIARGGQGAVFTTQAEGAAVKLSTDNKASPTAIDARIRTVSRLPIGDLPVALPRLTLAQPYVGYTMSLLTGMVSSETLARRHGVEPILDWYVDSGGLRKRLRVIESLSRILATMHARGLVYGDLSGNNVLVSESPSHHRVFLIDLDNLRYAEEPGTAVFTPNYGAPEQDKETSQATDRFSLAVLAHSLITAANPFYGDLLDEMAPEDWGRPWSAHAAWIDHPDDDSNRWSKGVPRSVVLSPRLQGLFAQSFTTALRVPGQRPHASAFALAAQSALSAVVTCLECGWDNYVRDVDCACCSRPLQPIGYRVLEIAGGKAKPFRHRPFALLDNQGILEATAASLGLAGRPGTVALSISARDEATEVRSHVSDLSFADQRSADRSMLKQDQQFVVGRPGRNDLLFVPLGAPHEA